VNTASVLRAQIIIVLFIFHVVWLSEGPRKERDPFGGTTRIDGDLKRFNHMGACLFVGNHSDSLKIGCRRMTCPRAHTCNSGHVHGHVTWLSSMWMLTCNACAWPGLSQSSKGSGGTTHWTESHVLALCLSRTAVPRFSTSSI